MNSVLRMVKFGFVIWLVPFAVGMLIFKVVPPDTELFETLMAVVMAAGATVFSIMYLRKTDGAGLAVGLKAGGVWWVLAVILDAPWFLGVEQMRMSLMDYATDIGLTYAMIPIISGGIGYALDPS